MVSGARPVDAPPYPDRAAGFAATYVFAKDITQPEKIMDLLGSAVPELR